MRSIRPELIGQLAGHWPEADVAHGAPFAVSSYRRLAELVARLSYVNPDHLLFFRGQDRDYQSKAGGTTLYPAVYRGDHVPRREIAFRFERLEAACRLLVERLREQDVEGHADVARKRYIQWSLLQHYEVVPTPLLDLTQSLRVACSFAQLAGTTPRCYVYVLALPFVTNRIAVNSEHDLVNVRLLSICPPDALRPYFQEGYLAGTSDITAEFDSKTELDFRRRLVAKFEIPRSQAFWGDGFARIPKSALYPAGDRIQALCEEVKSRLASEWLRGDLGTFIREWAGLEEAILEAARRLTERNVSVREGIAALQKAGRIGEALATQLETLRRLRDIAVHTPERVAEASLAEGTRAAREAVAALAA